MSIERPSMAFAAETMEIPRIVDADPEQCVCPVGNIELNYLVWGDRAKPPVVLVHGGKDHSRNWDWTVAALIDSYCLITPDMRGHGDSGRSAGGGYQGDVYVSDFASFMDHLEAEGFDVPLPLIGHSMGGNIILNYAAAFPEKVTRMVAMEGLGASITMYEDFDKKPPAERLRKWVNKRIAASTKPARRFKTPDEMIARMASAHKNLRADQAQHLALHAARCFPDGWGWKHDPYIGFFPPVSMTSPDEYSRLYESIECPTLLMRGEDSWASDPEADGRIKAFKDARLINYADAGHWLHHDVFDAYIRDVKSFLEE